MPLQDFQSLRARVDARNDAIDEIGTIESADEDRRILQAQLRGDVGAHPLGCCCRVGVHAGPREATLDLGETAIFRTEIVSPVADAMGFVDGEGPNTDTFGELQESRHEQTLRRNE